MYDKEVFYGSPLNEKLTVGLIDHLVDQAHAVIQQLISNGKTGGKLDLTVEKLSNYDKDTFVKCFIKKYQKDNNGNDLFVLDFSGNNIAIQWNGGYIKAPSEIRHIKIEQVIVR